MADNKVMILTLGTTRDGCDGSEPSAFIVKKNGIQHGHFKIADCDSAHLALTAATTPSDSLEQHPWVSPFGIYRPVILDHYGTAAKLRRVVMGLWNGAAYPFNLSDISGIDDKHYAILLELLDSYRKFGEKDQVFMSLAQEIRHMGKAPHPL